MFRTHQLRPDTTQAIRVTTDNYPQVAMWLAENVADDQAVDVVLPGTEGQGRPRLEFTPHDTVPYIRPRTAVPIPGVLTADRYDDGVLYQTYSADEFDARWVLADTA